MGEKCTISCSLDGEKHEVLWDTGAEVALISQKWLDENIPGKEIQNVTQLLGQELFLKVANNSNLEYKGYTEIILQMSDVSEPLLVPFLVTDEEISMPMVGYNVIEEVVKGEIQNQNPKILEMLGGAFLEISSKKIEGLINMIQKKTSCDEVENLADVKVGNKDIVIPKGMSMKMKCISHCGPVLNDIPVIFQPDVKLELQSDLIIGEGVMTVKKGKTTRFLVPVSNPSSGDIVIKARTKVGDLISVASVIPCPVAASINSVAGEMNEDEKRCGEAGFKTEEELVEPKEEIQGEEWLSQMDLNHLSVSQRRKVKEMLRQESEVFAKDKGDIGQIEDLKMKIVLTDDIPVKKSYTSIPKPLYKEVKEYVEDLLARGWVEKSYSNYCSPMVCVRKRDGSLRLCIDYRQLNSKTIPDCQPIPKVQ
ncbi:MAG: hypothetical protein MK200_02450, partial [Nitrosopumilus sp.]|nr:hypothetical protein [Nitrosopumilus sp.]